MNLIDKTILSLILVTGILTSCNGFRSTTAIPPTEMTAMVTVTVDPTSTETVSVIPAATATVTAMSLPPPSPFPPTPIPFFTFPVDRHDPQSVIRAYFDAWERSDSSAMASVLSSKFGQNFMFEPLESMEILEIELVSDASPTERTYSVLYDAQWKDQADTDPIRWRFRLTWDADRDSWIIIGYGYG